MAVIHVKMEQLVQTKELSMFVRAKKDLKVTTVKNVSWYILIDQIEW